jgi:hypothetical protein
MLAKTSQLLFVLLLVLQPQSAAVTHCMHHPPSPLPLYVLSTTSMAM